MNFVYASSQIESVTKSISTLSDRVTEAETTIVTLKTTATVSSVCNKVIGEVQVTLYCELKKIVAMVWPLKIFGQK